jgi:SAM-dependent methyltransferase
MTDQPKGDFATFGEDYHGRFRPNLYTRIFGQRGPLLRLVTKHVSSGRLLDIGCGMGWWLSDAARHFRVSGCDYSEFALARARVRLPQAEAMVEADANEALPFESGAYDVVTALDVVEHMRDPGVLISEASRLLRPGGLFAFTTPNPNCFSARKWKPQDWHGVRDSTHINIRPASNWTGLASRNGFHVVDVRYDGLWDVPYSSAGRKTPVGKFVEHVVVQLPSVLAYNAGVRIPEALGENVLVLAVRGS